MEYYQEENPFDSAMHSVEQENLQGERDNEERTNEGN